MRNTKHAPMDLGLKRMEAVLRWRAVPEAEARDALNGRLARVRAFIAETELALAEAAAESERSHMAASDNIVRALTDLLKARRADDLQVAQSEIHRQLYEIAASQADAWSSVAEELRPAREMAPMKRPVPRDTQICDIAS